MKNINLNKARDAKNDEFYTMIEDIDIELSHYKNAFNGKIVLCNCDDPKKSNFFRYFYMNFEKLGLKMLVSTVFAKNRRGNAIRIDRQYPLDDIDGVVTDLSYRLEKNGDFASTECIDIMKGADVVITNPPFSLFRQFIALVLKQKKKFSVMGNINGITCKNILPSIISGDMWLGADSVYRNKWFEVPLGYPKRKNRWQITVDSNGIEKQWSSLGNVCWYTNLDHEKRWKKIDLDTEYDPIIHKRYDNYDAIEVGNCKKIPIEYNGYMGVPITFLDKHCPDQFDLIGYAAQPIVEGRKLYKRIIIQHRKRGLL